MRVGNGHSARSTGTKPQMRLLVLKDTSLFVPRSAMTRAEEYRRRAKEAEEKADNASEPRIKQYFRGVASEWQKFADQAEPRYARKPTDRGVQPGQPANKMTREEAEHLRALLRRTRPADLNEPSVLLRIGRAIAQAIYRRGPKRRSREH